MNSQTLDLFNYGLTSLGLFGVLFVIWKLVSNKVKDTELRRLRVLNDKLLDELETKGQELFDLTTEYNYQREKMSCGLFTIENKLYNNSENLDPNLAELSTESNQSN